MKKIILIFIALSFSFLANADFEYAVDEYYKENAITDLGI